MMLETLLRYLDFVNIVLEVWYDEEMWRFSEFETIPDKFMTKHVKYFTPKTCGMKYCVEVILFKE